MRGTKSLEGWRAEEIAKVYLLNSGLVNVLEDSYDNFDFLAMSKSLPDKKFAIEVKATKSPKGAIKRNFSKVREKVSQTTLPVLLMYINSDEENGYFEVFKKNQGANHEIQPLRADKLKEQISELINY